LRRTGRDLWGKFLPDDRGPSSTNSKTSGEKKRGGRSKENVRTEDRIGARRNSFVLLHGVYGNQKVIGWGKRD